MFGLFLGYLYIRVYREIFCLLAHRRIGSSKEQARREQMAEQRANGGYDGTQDDDEEEDYMEF